MFVPLAGPASSVATQEPMPGWATWAAVALVALSTLTGAYLARRNTASVSVWLAVASALMLVTALVDLLPDAWEEAEATGVPLWVVGLAGVFGFVVITYFTRKGCGHQHDEGGSGGRHAPGVHRRVRQAVSAAVYGGVGTAAALSLHRMIEGATLALAASAVVVAALVVHSASEGLALTALLDLARKRLAPWLTVSCLAPATGVVLATVAPLPPQSVPILLGMITGVLLRTALIGLTIARDSRRLSRRHLILAATAVAAIGGLLVSAQALLSAGRSEGAAPVAAAPLPRPSAAPLSRQLTPAELRAAVATGRIGLESLLSRRDATTIGADAATLLRVLPGHAPDEITETLRKAKIDGGATIGDLTLRQRHLLLAALSDAPPAR
ncbi:hypothetical protein ACFPOI_32770 [Nonomuraea angiospora]|uniref:Zinc transporter ZupT n=1 Tax=Nonomuraea angiospora TaxID=46172 RepID=A0ABR9LSH3_9ACTN|nr:hypothetical protein [Nonomuraea angiospora]MBE1583606.1 hypothetical protein [Nonomuraea angiospora]